MRTWRKIRWIWLDNKRSMYAILDFYSSKIKCEWCANEWKETTFRPKAPLLPQTFSPTPSHEINFGETLKSLIKVNWSLKKDLFIFKWTVQCSVKCQQIIRVVVKTAQASVSNIAQLPQVGVSEIRELVTYLLLWGGPHHPHLLRHLTGGQIVSSTILFHSVALWSLVKRVYLYILHL